MMLSVQCSNLREWIMLRFCKVLVPFHLSIRYSNKSTMRSVKSHEKHEKIRWEKSQKNSQITRKRFFFFCVTWGYVSINLFSRSTASEIKFQIQPKFHIFLSLRLPEKAEKGNGIFFIKGWINLFFECVSLILHENLNLKRNLKHH